MKKEISMKRVQRDYTLYQTGYCKLKEILAAIEPEFYNFGIYGWNCDIYVYRDIAICTGYRNLRGKEIPKQLIALYTIKSRDAQTLAQKRQVADDFFRDLKNGTDYSGYLKAAAVAKEKKALSAELVREAAAI